MLDEKAFRKPGFDEAASVPIVLADGQPWYFPKPTIWVWGPVVEGRDVSAGVSATFGREYDDLLDRLEDAGDFSDKVTAIFAVAVDLLGRNYGLTPEDYRRLLKFIPGDADNEATWTAIMAVARGFDAPKASPGGSA